MGLSHPASSPWGRWVFFMPYPSPLLRFQIMYETLRSILYSFGAFKVLTYMTRVYKLACVLCCMGKLLSIYLSGANATRVIYLCHAIVIRVYKFAYSLLDVW